MENANKQEGSFSIGMHYIRDSSVKNNADALIFHTAICFWAKANSFDVR